MSAATPAAKRALAVLAVLTLAVPLGGCGASSDEPAHPGKAVYLRYCFSCHQPGVAGAPKFGDRKAWRPRLAQGRDALLHNVKKGMPPGMPARGACPSCDDETLAAAVDYMVVNVE